MKAQRPTWRQAFDLGIEPSADTRSSATVFDANLGLPQQWLQVQQGLIGTFALLGASGTNGSGVIQVVDTTDVAFFEGEFSMIRLHGYLRIPCVLTNDFSTGDEGRVIEVRAWMYKTWEQEVNGRVGLVHPFNESDFDARILWSARWFHLLQSQRGPVGALSAPGAHLEAHADIQQAPTSGVQSQMNVVQAYNDQTTVRTFSIKQAVKIKGSERVAIAIAAGPFQENGASIFVPVFGCARMLVKH